MRIEKELTSSLEGLIAIRMKIHTASVNAELHTGQPQFPLAQVLEHLDKTITFLTKEARAVSQDRKPFTTAERLKSFVGIGNE